MDFELSSDQEALVEGMQSLLSGRFDMDVVRAMADTGGIDRGRWAELGETGVFSLALPEDQGGVGLGWVDTTLVFEQLGTFVVPGPLVATALAAGLVDGAAEGSAVVGYIERPAAGEPAIVEYGPSLDVLLVGDADGLHRIDPALLEMESSDHPLDPLTPVAIVKNLPAGEQVADAARAAVWRQRGAVLTAALQLGLAGGSTMLAVEYAKERQQFGKVIGSFQAIKHICADMLGRTEVAKAAVYMAGLSLDDPEIGDPARTSAVAKILADQAGVQCGKDCTQVHGGMGYTWEINAHLFLKRAWVLETAFGSAVDHAEFMATTL